MTTEDPVDERVLVLLEWAAQKLDLLSSSFRGCDDDELEALRVASSVEVLPAAYAAFMRATGVGGAGSALVELFPGDDVSAEQLKPANDWPGGRGVAKELLAEKGFKPDLHDAMLVIRVHRATEVEFIDIRHPDSPVWGFCLDKQPPKQTFDSFTSWLEYRIGRAIKRRYPLRDAHFEG